MPPKKKAKKDAPKKKRQGQNMDKMTAKKIVTGLMTPNQSDAETLRNAGFAPSTANKKAKKYTQHPLVQSMFMKELAKANVTAERLAEKISEGLDATKEVSFIFNRIVERMGIKDDKMKEQLANEFTDDFISVPDYSVQHKFLETALKCTKILEQAPGIHMEVAGDVVMKMSRDELTEEELLAIIAVEEEKEKGR